MQAQFDAVRAKVTECIQLAEQKFGIKMPEVQVRFDLRGKAAGMACAEGYYYARRYSVRFNVDHIRLGGQSWEHLLNDTVPHEIAHTVCQAFPQFGRNHDAGWKRVCIALGGSGSRLYTEEDAPEAVAKSRPFIYTTTTGHKVRFSVNHHQKIQAGRMSGKMRNGKGYINKECAYVFNPRPVDLDEEEAPVAKPAVTVQLPPAMPTQAVVKTRTVTAVKQATAGVGSKADQVRAKLRSGASAEETVMWAVTHLGMSKQLAKTYVKNNMGK